MAKRNISENGPPPGYKYIFVTSFFHKGLKRKVFAYEYGKKSFRLCVPIDRRAA